MKGVPLKKDNSNRKGTGNSNYSNKTPTKATISPNTKSPAEKKAYRCKKLY